MKQVIYSRSADQKFYKKNPLMSELHITEEVLMGAFKAIIRGSDEGTHELTHNVKGKDANVLYNIALFERDRTNVILKIIDDNC